MVDKTNKKVSVEMLFTELRIKKVKRAVIVAIVAVFVCVSSFGQDLQADNMLLYQRTWGGWPKAVNGVKLDYSKALTLEEKKKVVADSLRKDATIDNGSTVKEIRYLSKAYKQHNNPAYLNAVNKGVLYLLKAQYPVGGWPQYFPDSSLYRGQITYNDNAIANVLNLLMDASLGIKDLEIVNESYHPGIKEAISKGVNCILVTQIKVNGELTAWCTQYDQKTLKPANARTFEKASISSMESVGIVQFLMRLDQPSAEVKRAITAAVNWLSKVKMQGYAVVDIVDASQPKGKDRIVKADPASTIWARFYEIETFEPFFSGRDGVKKKKLEEIEVERRTGYAWYGTWGKKLLEKDYPNWLKKNAG